MKKGRLEAFSDGVVAIIITIMVLELHVPHTDSIGALIPVLPALLSYVLSFVYVGIYWNNHHHMFHAAKSVTGGVLWANLHLLFWLSLVPFVSGWMGEHTGESLPVGLYGCVLLMCGVAYWILARLLVRHEGPDSVLARARALIPSDLPVAFAHRYITRPADAGGENHVALSEVEFERLRALDLFIFH